MEQLHDEPPGLSTEIQPFKKCNHLTNAQDSDRHRKRPAYDSTLGPFTFVQHPSLR